MHSDLKCDPLYKLLFNICRKESILSKYDMNSSIWLPIEDKAEIFLSTSAFSVTDRAAISILNLLLWKENSLLLPPSFRLRGHFDSISTLFHAWFLIYIQFFLAPFPFRTKLLPSTPVLFVGKEFRELHAAPAAFMPPESSY